MRFFERLNTPVAVVIVSVIILVVDGCLFFYRYNLQSQSAGSTTAPSPIFRIDLDTAVEEITLSSPEQTNDTQQDSLTATSLLIALLIIGVINVLVTLLSLLSARRRPTAGEHLAGYPGEERHPLRGEARSSGAQPQVHKLEQEILKLRREYEQLAEELARVRTLHKEAERERERILEGLQNIQQVLQRKGVASSEEENRSKRSPRAQGEGST